MPALNCPPCELRMLDTRDATNLPPRRGGKPRPRSASELKTTNSHVSQRWRFRMYIFRLGLTSDSRPRMGRVSFRINSLVFACYPLSGALSCCLARTQQNSGRETSQVCPISPCALRRGHLMNSGMDTRGELPIDDCRGRDERSRLIQHTLRSKSPLTGGIGIPAVQRSQCGNVRQFTRRSYSHAASTG